MRKLLSIAVIAALTFGCAETPDTKPEMVTTTSIVTDAERTFWHKINAHPVLYSYRPGGLRDIAYRICEDADLSGSLINGLSYNDGHHTEPWTTEVSDFFIAAVVEGFCPRHLPLLE